MRVWVAVVLALMNSAAAIAQPPSTAWTDPSGLFSLDTTGFINQGPDGDTIAAVFTLADAPDGPPQVQCMIHSRNKLWSAGGTLNDADANLMLSGMLGDDKKATASRIDGTKIFDWYKDGGTYEIHYRAFQLPSERGNDYHDISCGGSKPITSEQWAKLDGLLNSLRIHRPAKPILPYRKF